MGLCSSCWFPGNQRQRRKNFKWGKSQWFGMWKLIQTLHRGFNSGWRNACWRCTLPPHWTWTVQHALSGCTLTFQNSLSDSKVRILSHSLINEVLDIAGFCGLPVILLKSVFLWQSYVALKLFILIKIVQIEKERQMWNIQDVEESIRHATYKHTLSYLRLTIFCSGLKKNESRWADEMVQWIKLLAAKPNKSGVQSLRLTW